MQPSVKPVVLCILDGWGYRDAREGNALALADLPVYRRLWSESPRSFVATSGPEVGLPPGQMGNSEVGHMNIGGGRILVQDLDRISNAASDGTLAANPVLRDVIARTKTAGGALHIMGLLSDGGVHSHQDHIFALARIGAEAGLRVWLHVWFDGRDVPPQSAHQALEALRPHLNANIAIATAGGRFYAMDRDQRWERVAPAYDALTEAKGPRFASAGAAVEAAYADGITDEFIVPAVIGGYAGARDGDGLVMANFRADRARQILTALLDPAFSGFDRAKPVRFAAAAGVTQYSEALAKLLPSLFPPVNVPDALGEVIAKAGLKQLRLAETEKYAHVTFFFNGGRELVFDGEERILVPSPKVRTYDLAPAMAAAEVTEHLVAAIEAGRHDLIVVNYANADQVGHTGKLEPAIQAVEAVDRCLGRVEAALRKAGGVMLLTADHGNVEMMIDPETGGPHTAHTTFDVPLLLVNAQVLPRGVTLKPGRLSDLAPTILALMGLKQPAAMTGRNLAEGLDVHAKLHA